MPRIQPVPSSGDLLNLPQGMVPTGATLAGAPSADAPPPLLVSFRAPGVSNRKSALFLGLVGQPAAGYGAPRATLAAAPSAGAAIAAGMIESMAGRCCGNDAA